MSPINSSLIKNFAVATTYPKIATNGLILNLDAGQQSSYNGGTTWRDLSGNGNNGSLINGVGYNSANGGSLSFDGVNDYVTLGNVLRYQGDFSLEILCKFETIPNNPGSACGARFPIIYNHDYGYNVLIDSTGKLNFLVYYSVSTNKAILTPNSVISPNYFHIVCIKNGVNISLYLNKILIGTEVLPQNSIYYENNPFVIGGFGTCGPNKFYSIGNISIVHSYNRALSTAEIQQNFNALRGRYGL